MTAKSTSKCVVRSMCSTITQDSFPSFATEIRRILEIHANRDQLQEGAPGGDEARQSSSSGSSAPVRADEASAPQSDGTQQVTELRNIAPYCESAGLLLDDDYTEDHIKEELKVIKEYGKIMPKLLAKHPPGLDFSPFRPLPFPPPKAKGATSSLRALEDLLKPMYTMMLLLSHDKAEERPNVGELLSVWIACMARLARWQRREWTVLVLEDTSAASEWKTTREWLVSQEPRVSNGLAVNRDLCFATNDFALAFRSNSISHPRRGLITLLSSQTFRMAHCDDRRDMRNQIERERQYPSASVPGSTLKTGSTPRLRRNPGVPRAK